MRTKTLIDNVGDKWRMRTGLKYLDMAERLYLEAVTQAAGKEKTAEMVAEIQADALADRSAGTAEVERKAKETANEKFGQVDPMKVNAALMAVKPDIVRVLLHSGPGFDEDERRRARMAEPIDDDEGPVELDHTSARKWWLDYYAGDAGGKDDEGLAPEIGNGIWNEFDKMRKATAVSDTEQKN